MHRRHPWLKVVAVATLLLLGLVRSTAASPKRGGTLRMAYGNEIAHLDFHTAPGYEMQWVAMHIGCGLLNVTSEGQFVGDTASPGTSPLTV